MRKARYWLLIACVMSIVFVTAPAQAQNSGMWINPTELASLPMNGAAWSKMNSVARGSIGTAQLSNQDSNHDVNTIAVAIVAMRTGDSALREKAAVAIVSAINTENGGRTLALGRNLVGYIIAADLIDLRTYSPARHAAFSAWLNSVRRETLDGMTLISTHEKRPNNWGTHAGASRVAADIYLGDTTDLNRAAQVFKGWLGDRSAYSGFKYGELSWQCNQSAPVGVNPACSAQKGGAMPDDMRRGGSFRYPPSRTNYAWGALQGATVQAYLLERAGFGVIASSDRAICRAPAYLWQLHTQFGGWWATGDDTWQPHLINQMCGTSYPETLPARPGKNMGWTDYTHTR